jgi:hypothetical protein
MSVAEQNVADLGLKHLDGRTFDAILLWLEQALRGHEALPRVVPGESPEDSILRHERTLMTITRTDLREACRLLVRRFIRQPVDNDEFVAALFRLAKGFALAEIANDLHALASSAERFSILPAAQQKTLLSTLLDLRAPLPAPFWHELVARDPERFGVVSFSGLLRHAPAAALQILPLLPNDEGIADEVYVVLNQHAQLLNPSERDKMVTIVRAKASDSQPCVRAALMEWVDEQPPAQREASSPTVLARLDSAFRDRAARRNEIYKPQPGSARLLNSGQAPPP